MTVYFQITCHHLNNGKLDIPLARKADREICGKEEKMPKRHKATMAVVAKALKPVLSPNSTLI